MSFQLPEIAAAVALVALMVYALTGGADFGAGIWDRLATGPRKQAQRLRIESAIAPIWETNHVWLIFVVVVLFSAFPRAFAAIGIALYLPLSLVLLGIVLRGSAFVFRQYGQGSQRDHHLWGHVFGWASVLTPFFLGTALAAVSGGRIRVSSDDQVVAPVAAWFGLFPIVVGLFVVAAFAFLAAVYLCVETGDDTALREDFRRRALLSGLLLGLLSIVVRIAAAQTNPVFAERLFGWHLPALVLQGSVALLAMSALGALWRGHFRTARAFAVAQIAAIVTGWGMAQYPFVIAPDLALTHAAAPAATLKVILIGMALGSVILLPSLVWMFRVFKRD